MGSHGQRNAENEIARVLPTKYNIRRRCIKLKREGRSDRREHMGGRWEEDLKDRELPQVKGNRKGNKMRKEISSETIESKGGSGKTYLPPFTSMK